MVTRPRPDARHLKTKAKDWQGLAVRSTLKPSLEFRFMGARVRVIELGLGVMVSIGVIVS